MDLSNPIIQFLFNSGSNKTFAPYISGASSLGDNFNAGDVDWVSLPEGSSSSSGGLGSIVNDTFKAIANNDSIRKNPPPSGWGQGGDSSGPPPLTGISIPRRDLSVRSSSSSNEGIGGLIASYNGVEGPRLSLRETLAPMTVGEEGVLPPSMNMTEESSSPVQIKRKGGKVVIIINGEEVTGSGSSFSRGGVS